MPNKFRSGKRFQRKSNKINKKINKEQRPPTQYAWKVNEGADFSKSDPLPFYEHDGSFEDVIKFVCFFFLNGADRDNSLVFPGKLIQMQTETFFNMHHVLPDLPNMIGFPFELLDEKELNEEKKKMEKTIVASGGQINEELKPRIFFRLRNIEGDADTDEDD